MIGTIQKKAANALAVCSLALLPAGLLAQNDLVAAVPEDAFIIVQTHNTPADDFIEQSWAKVWDAVQKTGVIEEVWTIMMGALTEQDASAGELANEIKAAAMQVNWATLADREYVMTMRYNEDSLRITEFERQNADGTTKADANINLGPPQQVFFMRGSEAEKNFNAIRNLVDRLLAAGETGITIEEQEINGYRTLVFSHPQAGGLGAMMALKGDVIAAGFPTPDLFKEVVGGSAGSGLIDSDRYKSAFKGLGTAQTERIYFDMENLAGGLDTIFTKLNAAATQYNEAPDPELEMVTKVVSFVTSEMRTLDRTATIAHVDGNRSVTETQCFFGSKDTSVAKVMFSNEPLENPYRYIPQAAGSFTASSGFDPMVAYQQVRHVITELAPDGEAMLAQFDSNLSQFPIHLENDLLAWISGEVITMQVASGMQPQSAMLLKVKDEAQAKASLQKIFGLVDAMMAQNQGAQITRTESATLGPDFMVINHPMMAMAMMQPVLGVKDGFLMVGSSESVLKSVLDTAAGTSPNVTENEAFKRYGFDTKKAVQKVSFQDLSNYGAQTSMMMSMMAMGMGAAVAGAPPEVQRVPGLIARLAPAMNSIDFLESKASITWRDGDRLLGRQMTTYKDSAK